MEGFGMNAIKYLLFIFNLIFALSGLALIIVGAVVLYDIGSYSHFLENKVLAPPVVLIIAGAIIFLIAFLGCCGAIKENYYMLIGFAVLLIVIFIVELAVGIAAASIKDEFGNALRSGMKHAMANFTTEKDQQAWNSLQSQLKCCGITKPSDWFEYVGNSNVPLSCCDNYQSSSTGSALCRFDESNPVGVHQEGCYNKLKERIKDNIVLIMAVGLGITFIEVAGVVLACCLANSIRKEDEMK